jgi:hypothetical protein
MFIASGFAQHRAKPEHIQEDFMADNTPWSYIFDFTQSDGGWDPYTDIDGATAHWALGQGWKSGNGTVPNQSQTTNALRRTITAAAITTIHLQYTVSPTVTQVYFAGMVGELNGSDVIVQHCAGDAGTYIDVMLAINTTCDALRFSISLNGDGNEIAILSQMKINGIGPNPFLDHYCVACAINQIAQDIEEALDAFGL